MTPASTVMFGRVSIQRRGDADYEVWKGPGLRRGGGRRWGGDKKGGHQNFIEVYG